MTTPHKLLVIQAQNRVIAIQKFWVENHLDPVGRPVEQLDTPDLVEDRVTCVVCHVVSDNGGQRVSL